MKIKALYGAWDTEVGELSFQLLENGEAGRLTLPGRVPLDMPVGDWRILGQFLTRSLMASSIAPASRASGPSKLEPRAGAPWSDEEDERLIRAFRSGMDFGEIAASHGRTRNAIWARLESKGLVPSSKDGISANGQSSGARPHA